MKPKMFPWFLAAVFAAPITLDMLSASPWSRWGSDIRVDVIAMVLVVIVGAWAIYSVAYRHAERAGEQLEYLTRTVRNIEIFIDQELKRGHGSPSR